MRLLTSIVLIAFSGSAFSIQGGGVATEAKISALEGGLTVGLIPRANFGRSVTVLGDLDGDGIREVAVQSFLEGGSTKGSIVVLFLKPDLSVRHEQPIDDTQGGFSGSLASVNGFGWGLAALGDRDGDGFDELAVGAPIRQGAVFILTLNSDGTVRDHVEIAAGKGGFGGVLGSGDFFGDALTALPDLDGDGVDDLVVGAPVTSEVVQSEGAIWILFLNADGTVKDEQKVSRTQGGLSNLPGFADFLGVSVTHLGDLDGDGLAELAVGGPQDDAVGFDDGSVWILSLNADGTVRWDTKINGLSNGLKGPIEDQDYFGWSVESLGDVDADGFPDLAVGAPQDDDGGNNRGAIYVLGLHPDGRVAVESKISETQGSFESMLDGTDLFGYSVAYGGDLNADGFPDLLTGTVGDDDGPDAFINRGAVWLLGLAERGSFQVLAGSGINPPCLDTTAAPALNAAWSGDVDATVHPSPALTILAGRDRELSPGVLTGAGELLIDLVAGGFVFDLFVPSGGGTDTASFSLPNDLSLLGFEVFAQAAVLGGGVGMLCNGLRLEVGI